MVAGLAATVLTVNAALSAYRAIALVAAAAQWVWNVALLSNPIGLVIVAVAAAHRGEAFAGAREAIDRIKAEAPIWKREIEGGESRWVEGQSPSTAG